MRWVVVVRVDWPGIVIRVEQGAALFGAPDRVGALLPSYLRGERAFSAVATHMRSLGARALLPPRFATANRSASAITASYAPVGLRILELERCTTDVLP